MKYLLISLISLLSLNIYAQEDKTVTLVVNGKGKTQDEATTYALRGAIEKAFGVFISSKTEILNDSLVKDEVSLLTTGNIKSYQKISEIKLDDQNIALTLSVTVSLNKLKDFVKSKGFVTEFNGNLFAMNVLLKEHNNENEEKIMFENSQIAKKFITKIFDYKIQVVSPQKLENNIWSIGMTIQVFSNENSRIFFDWLHNIIKSITLTKQEILEYKSLNMDYYKVNFVYGNNVSWEGGQYYFRNKKSIEYINSIYKQIINLFNTYEITNTLNYKYGKLMYPDPEILNLNRSFMGVSDNWWRYGKRTISAIPSNMTKYDDGTYDFFIIKKGVNVISFANNDVMSIEDLKKIQEYKIVAKQEQ